MTQPLRHRSLPSARVSVSDVIHTAATPLLARFRGRRCLSAPQEQSDEYLSDISDIRQIYLFTEVGPEFRLSGQRCR